MCDGWEDSEGSQGYNYQSNSRPSYNSQNYEQQRYGGSRGGARGGSGFGGRGGGGSRGSRNFSNSNRTDMRSGGGRDNWNRGGGGGNEQADILKVPSRFVGRIIGRGGSKINELQSESGARIQVTKDTEGEETIIKLYGSPDTVSRAKELISDLTTERAGFMGNST